MALRSAAPSKPPGVDVYFFREAVPEALWTVVERHEIHRTSTLPLFIPTLLELRP